MNKTKSQEKTEAAEIEVGLITFGCGGILSIGGALISDSVIFIVGIFLIGVSTVLWFDVVRKN